MDKNTRIIITGATGFIGRSLLSELLAKGYSDITAAARITSNVNSLKDKGINIVIADITDKKTFDCIAGEYDVLFHCAGFVNDNDEESLGNVNIHGTENICQWAFERKIKKLIYLSSVAVNSGNADIPLTEDMPYKSTNKYGFSKLEAEKKAVSFRDKGLPIVIVRPCIVYGVGEPHMMLLLFKLLRLRLLMLPNLGEPRLHLVSVRNVAVFLVQCMEDDRAMGGIFHIADNEAFDLSEIFGIFAESLGVHKPLLLSYPLTRLLIFMPVIGKRIKFLCKDRVYSIERIKKTLNFIPPYQAYSELSNSVKNLK